MLTPESIMNCKEESEQLRIYNPLHWIKAGGIWAKKKLFCLWTFSASFFTEVAPFAIEIDSMKKIF